MCKQVRKSLNKVNTPAAGGIKANTPAAGGIKATAKRVKEC